MEWVDTESLQVLQTWTGSGFSKQLPGSISDNGMALAGGSGGLKIGRPDGPWHPLCSLSEVYCGAGPFVNNESVLSMRLQGPEQWKMNLMNTNGELLFEQNFPRGELFSAPARRAADGRRFALTFYKGKGGSSFLDVAPRYSLKRIMVYDVPTRQWVCALDAKKQGIKGTSGLALSPDGTLLALINQDRILEVYRLPDTPAAPGQSEAKEAQSAPAH